MTPRRSGILPAWWPTPLVGALGGFLASFAGWPLPWLTGALLAVILARCSGWLLVEVPNGRKAGQWIIASALGLHFTQDVWDQVLAHFGIILLGAIGTLLLSLIGIGVLTRAGVDRATAFFSSMPGGASEMVNLALRHDAEPARVAAAHSLRLLLVVLTIPALFTWSLPPIPPPQPLPVDYTWLLILLPAGAGLALIWQRLGQPNPWMLGPLIACALASVLFDLHLGMPEHSGKVGQWLIGMSLACHFDRPFFKSAPGFLLRILLFTLLAMLTAGALAWLLGQVSQLNVLSLMLGMMPGGITELCLVAEALQLSVAMVTAIQVLRFFLVLFLAEPCFRLWQKRSPA